MGQGNKLEVFLLPMLALQQVSISSSPLTGFASCDIVSVTIVPLWDYFGSIQHLESPHLTAQTHAVQYNQLGPQSLARHQLCTTMEQTTQGHTILRLQSLSAGSSATQPPEHLWHKPGIQQLLLYSQKPVRSYHNVLCKQSWREAHNWNPTCPMPDSVLREPPSLHIVLHLQLSTSTVPEQWKDLLHRHYKLMDRWGVRVSFFRNNFISSLFRGTSSSLLFIYSFQFA